MAMAAIPAIAAAGSSIYGAYQANQASQPSAGQQQAQQGALQAGQQQAKTGQQLTNFGMPLMSQSAKYFQTLAGGNRAATSQMLAPQIQQTGDVYGGTASSLNRFLRGSSRDYQLAQADVQKGGQIASLFSGGRTAANTALGSIGSGAVGQGTTATGNAGGIFGASAAQQQQQQYQGAQLGFQAGQGTGQLLFNLLKMYQPGKGGGGGGNAGNVGFGGSGGGSDLSAGGY